ncbi:DNRLRE domain-containing protein [Streptomyces alkaliterrae]|uniref:DNRLRE domain-containing protein n=1 Tax=Streptomyces alkaliterrae TaxID=2213162 RepID=A0A5P0YJG9_9ACTN|nr:DNRLRE domain-containing protein [Streptomyces alkaliterrae]MBB1260226.1 VCBS repeat-containing protein [Streptomyces alkaliterrae]MQS00523.1 DNRLRE domain-containing protein [Streptomyces alkaliterrae]
MSDTRFRQLTRGRSPGGRALAAVLALATVSAIAPTAAQAKAQVGAASDSAPTAEERALEAAAESGKAVEVRELRSETSEVHATPDGTFRLTQHAQPVRVRKNGRWAPVDTTLAQVDGRVAARAAAGDVTFSPGGTGPLVTFKENGRELSLSWPKPLPRPVLEGNVARYPEVLPDVDLAVAADVDGFSQVLVVKTAEAARHPQLAKIDFGLRTKGLSLSADPDSGALSAKDPSGKALFTTSTARMWDSSRPTDTTPKSPAARTSPALTGSPAAAGRPEATPGDLEAGSRGAPVKVEVSRDSLALSPDRALLGDRRTTFPVFIDPRFSGSREAWTTAYKPYPNNSYWNGTGWGSSAKDARVGYESATRGTARSFFRMNAKGLAGVQVLDAQFNIKLTHSWSCSARPVELWLTGAISSATTWNKQPSWSTKLDTLNVAGGNESVGCADRGVDFKATEAARRAAANKWSNVTFGLRASNESDTFGWKRFAPNPTLIVEYNRTPKDPWNLDTVPSTHNGTDCGYSSQVWVGNTDVKLSAYVSDPDGGNVRVQFHLWATGKRYDPPGLLFDKSVTVSSKSTGTYAQITVPKTLLQQHLAASGGRYSWKARAHDAHSSSDWTPTLGAPGCQFGFDPNRPSKPPTVTSVQYPDGSDGTMGAPARTPGTFTIGSGGISDVVEYRYELDRYPPTRKAVPGSPGGSVQVSLTPASAGPHTLYVQSVDRAGNVSDTQRYTFLAESIGIRDKPGDLNGDGTPDFYSVDPGGELRLHRGESAGRMAPPVNVGPGWSGALITQRGDWTGSGYSDLVARRPDGKLWLYPNDGLGMVKEATRREVSQFVDEDGDAYFDPASIRDLVAVGDLSARTESAVVDLLAVIGDQLWFLPGYTDGYVDEPVLIGDGGWRDRTLVSPGDLDGDGATDLLVREPGGDLWLYRGQADPENAGATLPASLADPANRVRYATGWTPAARPLITAPGDGTGDGITDLWATDGGGRLLHVPGTASAAGTPVEVETSGWQGVRAVS